MAHLTMNNSDSEAYRNRANDLRVTLEIKCFPQNTLENY
jgi:hypothetical protein